MADQQEHLSQEIDYALNGHHPRNHARSLVHIKEIYERDFRPDVKDLCALPEFYQWRLPEYLFAHLRDTNKVRLMRITQDSLVPTIVPGDYILIDCDVREIEGNRGLYLMADGVSTYIRRVEVIRDPKDDSPAYRLNPENDQVKLEARIVKPSTITVLGRVFGKLNLFY